MPAPVSKTGWTVEMLEDLPDDGSRYEIIDGELFVSPMPSLRHQRAVRELGSILIPFAQRLGEFEVFSSPIGVTFARTTEVQPDLSALPFVGGELATTFSDVGRLLLAVEVLSPSTVRRDRYEKRMKYQQEKVPEYWIVDVDSRLVERWRPGDEEPEILETKMTWRPLPAAEELTIDLEAYFRAVCGE